MSRILLLVDRDQDRRRLREWLSPDHELLAPDPGSEAERSLVNGAGRFDLGIIDTLSLERLSRGAQAARTAAPVEGLPLLLVAAREDLGAVAPHLGTTVDDLILRPLDPRELAARVATLRARAGGAAAERGIRSALDEAGIGVWEWDAATGRLEWSRQLERIAGLAPGSFGGTLDAFFDAVHADDRERVMDEVSRTMAEGARYEFHFRTVWSDGGVHWADGLGRVVRDGAGRPVCAVGIGLDVTERKRAEAEAEARERRQAALLELGRQALTAPDSTSLMESAADLVARTLEVDCCGVLELLPGGEALRLAAGVGWESGLVGHARVGVDHTTAAGCAALSGEAVVIEDLRAATPCSAHGLLREQGMVSSVTAPIRGNGRPFGVIGAHTRRRRSFVGDEVSFLQAVADTLAQAVHRREAEDRLRLVLEQLPVALWTTDTGLRVVSYTGSLVARLGLGPGAGLGGRVGDYLRALGPDTSLGGAMRRALAGESSDFDMDWEGMGFHHHVGPLRERAGTVVGVIVLSQDVTERVRADAALRASEERYRDLVESAHDLVHVIALDGRFLFVNRAWQETLGYTEADLHDLTVSRIIHPDSLPHCLEVFSRIEAGEPVTDVETTYLTRDGRSIHLEGKVRACYQDGKAVAIQAFLRDVTTRREAEAARERLLAILEASPDLISLAGADERLLYVNPAGRRLAGFTGDVTKTTFADHVPPGEYERLKAEALPVAAREGQWQGETGIVTHDGRVVPVSQVVVAHRGADGTVEFYSTIARDITERRRSEEERARLAAVLEATSDFVGMVDRAQRVLYVNPAARRALRIPADQNLTGVPLADIVPRAKAEYERLMATAFPVAVRDGQWSGETTWHGRDGDTIPVWQVIIAPRGADGEVAFIAVVARDITEQKKREAALRAQAARLTEQARLLDLAQIVVRDPESRIILWNTGAEKLYGWTKSEAIGRVSHDLFRTVFPEPLEAISARLVDTGHWEGELTNTTKDDRRLVVASHWVLQRDERGTPSAVLEVSNDITEPKRLEQELVESQSQLRALSARLQSVLEEERARVARDIHDDLGQALTALKLDVSWLNGRFAGPRGAPKRALAEKTRAMLDLIDTTAGKVRNIATALRPGVLDSLGLPAALEWLAKDFEARSGIPCRLTSAVRSRRLAPDVSLALFRIVQESLTNVARHARATGVTVALREGADELVVEVRDDGRGITLSEQLGTGSLGLLGMRERARLLGGRVTMHGEEGQGTVVRARVPLARPAEARAEPPGA